MKITICSRKLKGGRRSLYLNFAERGERRRKALGIVLERPVDAATREINRRKLRQATMIRARYELSNIASVWELPPLERRVVLLVEAYARFERTYAGTDVAVVRAVGRHLVRFLPSADIYLHEVDTAFCVRFLAYLQERLHGSSPAGYFKKFRRFLAQSRRRGLLAADPSEGIRVVADEGLSKAVLAFGELNRLAAAPCAVPEVKRAFLFACNTGLRWCDVRRLRTSDIDAERGEMTVVQRKVEGHSRRALLRVGLNANARRLLAAVPREMGAVFDLPSYGYASRALAQWARAAGIGKHLTFHCARHTFISNLIAQGTHLSVAASLAGHSSTRHTERYVHLSDHRRREAVDRLAPLRMEL